MALIAKLRHENYCVIRLIVNRNPKDEHNISVFSATNMYISYVYKKIIINNYYCNDLINHHETKNAVDYRVNITSNPSYDWPISNTFTITIYHEQFFTCTYFQQYPTAIIYV